MKVKKRDFNIVKHIKKEINLTTKKIKNKKIYDRNKYKRGFYD